MNRAMRKPDSTVARRAFLDCRCNDNTQCVTTRFSARKRYFASCASFLHTFFWKDRKKYARGATVAVLPHKAALRCNRRKASRILRMRSPRAFGADKVSPLRGDKITPPLGAEGGPSMADHAGGAEHFCDCTAVPFMR